MSVSVIIPVYNELAALPNVLRDARSLAADVLFVDGGSNDGTVEALQASGVRWIGAPQGRAAQMNAGAAAANGDILLFLHADTRLPESALDAVRKAIRDGADGGSFDVTLDTTRPLLRIVGRMISLRSRLTGVASGDQAIFVSRSAFESLGGFAPMALFEDIDLSRRLKRHGRTVRLRPPVRTSARRWERGGAVRTILQMWVLRALYYCGVAPDALARHYREAR